MRALTLLFLLAFALTACSGNDRLAENVETPQLEQMSEAPGDWSALDGMVGRIPSESGLITHSPITVDLQALLGPDFAAYRAAMMRAGPLARVGDVLVSSGEEASLTIKPGDHALRASLMRGKELKDWVTPGAEVPILPPPPPGGY